MVIVIFEPSSRKCSIVFWGFGWLQSESFQWGNFLRWESTFSALKFVMPRAPLAHPGALEYFFTIMVDSRKPQVSLDFPRNLQGNPKFL